ncbi:DNA-binding protein [Amphritea balenae]|uniref:DNA-binding protein n=1 Tax=Amphritea balenae TaxID=452629 RepID=A0A3P1SLX9_9GAMM|nr:DNA-binding protein [Amphritea balenae]RRC97949.1 DNA-binding protein [Amphritea balenae]GGK82028.1 hypothetical protein GCM10007941_35560 [Amphritea balenae]
MTIKKQTTYDKVFDAADKLLAAGQKPTQQHIRNELGTGSLTTINKALNDWWQGLGQRLVEQRQRPDIPEPVFDSASALWQQALIYAEAQLAEQREAIEQHYLQLKQEIDTQSGENQNDLQRLQDLSDRLLTDNQRYLDNIAELQQKQRASDEREMHLQTENRELARQQKELELVVERLDRSSGNIKEQEILEYRHKNQYLEGECNRLVKHNDSLVQENRGLREALFDAERKAIKEKHEFELVINQQDLRYQEIERQLHVTSDTDPDDSGLTIRLQEKEQEVQRLHELLKSLNKSH